MSGERRYALKDVCTACWYDNCETCRGGGCACRKYNHPNAVPAVKGEPHG